MFVLSCSPEKAPDKPSEIVISFRDGDPVAIDGRKLSPANLLAQLNELGGKNGIGRVDIVENRYVGMKSRGVYETPGGTILKVAHRGMEQITMDREVMRLRDDLMPRYAALVYNGYWFSPEREALQKLIDESQKGVTGDVRVKLYKGTCTVTGRRSKYSLYNPQIATFEEDEVYDQKDAAGFIKLNALRLKVRAQVRKQGKK
jgi:argininosuccinate synthase